MSDTTADVFIRSLPGSRKLIVGWITGVIIAVSIGYADLILGFSIEDSELEANQSQEAQQRLTQAAKDTA